MLVYMTNKLQETNTKIIKDTSKKQLVHAYVKVVG